MSQKVITVTLNPSLDRTLVTHYLSVGYHNRTSETTRLDPAGRGVSIARALKHLGITTHSVIGLGDDATGYAYQALIAKEQLPVTFIQRNGLTRSNVVILDTGNQTETSLIEESAGISPENLEAVKTALRSRSVTVRRSPGERTIRAKSRSCRSGCFTRERRCRV